MTAAPEQNPYASPEAEDELVAVEFETYRQGDLVVAQPHSALPARCTVCNQPASNERVLTAHGWISTSGLTNVSVRWFVCNKHHGRLAGAKAARILTIVLCIVAAWVVAVQLGSILPADMWNLIPFATLAIASFAGRYIFSRLHAWAGQPLAIHTAKPGEVHLRGAGEPFLQSLSDYRVETQTYESKIAESN